jgi:copper(I)-binding protein
MKNKRVLVFLFAALILVACGEGKWHTHDAYTRPTQQGGTAAVYFLLHNATSSDDALVGATTDVAPTVEIHKSGLADDLDGMVAGSAEADHEHGEGEGEDHEHSGEGEDHEHEGAEDQPMTELEMQDMADVSGMTMLTRVDIAAGREILFEPGSYHLMLIGLTRELVAGDKFALTLHFEKGEDLTLEVSVLAP